MHLVCVRHGQTAWNARRLFQGHTDVPLDERGRQQAAALGALLARERFDAAVSSDLARAAETAKIVLGDRDVALRLDPDWREMRFGEWEGLSWEQIVAANPQLDPNAATSPRAYRPANGESFDELCERVRRAVTRIEAELPDDGVALVATHAGPLHALIAVLLSEADRTALAVRFATASVTRFRRTNGIWSLVRLNQTAQPAS